MKFRTLSATICPLTRASKRYHDLSQIGARVHIGLSMTTSIRGLVCTECAKRSRRVSGRSQAGSRAVGRTHLRGMLSTHRKRKGWRKMLTITLLVPSRMPPRTTTQTTSPLLSSHPTLQDLVGSSSSPNPHSSSLRMERECPIPCSTHVQSLMCLLLITQRSDTLSGLAVQIRPCIRFYTSADAAAAALS